MVKIDESCFGKQKYNRGRILREQQWVFGGIDIQTKKCFMVEVDQRNTQTLLPIIQQYILPGKHSSFQIISWIHRTLGTTIHSDEWRAYRTLGNELLYTHSTVNHSLFFVDPRT